MIIVSQYRDCIINCDQLVALKTCMNHISAVTTTETVTIGTYKTKDDANLVMSLFKEAYIKGLHGFILPQAEGVQVFYELITNASNSQ